MDEQVLTLEMIESYRNYLREEEKSKATIEKYMRDILCFYRSLPERKTVSKERVICYKESLLETYQIASINSMLVALNRMLSYLGWDKYRVKTFKCQRTLVSDSDRELTKEEYVRLVQAAEKRGNDRMSMIIQTICGTGIRVGELSFITKETIFAGKVLVHLKGKNRTVILPKELKRKLMKYCREKNIVSGPVFVTRTGRPMDRSNIWSEMKQLCAEARVEEKKVFPHNLRHLFARTYYKKNKDIIYLADILGHSNVNTTRIYTAVSRREHEKVLSKMGLVI